MSPEIETHELFLSPNRAKPLRKKNNFGMENQNNKSPR